MRQTATSVAERTYSWSNWRDKEKGQPAQLHGPLEIDFNDLTGDFFFGLTCVSIVRIAILFTVVVAFWFGSLDRRFRSFPIAPRAKELSLVTQNNTLIQHAHSFNYSRENDQTREHIEWECCFCTTRNSFALLSCLLIFGFCPCPNPGSTKKNLT